VITVPNTELKLKPGMTANVKIEIAKRTNALRVPNAALRFRPTQEVFAALNQTPPPEMTAFANAARGGRGGRGGDSQGAAAPTAAGASVPSTPPVMDGASAETARAVGPAGTAAPGAQAGSGGRGGRGGFGRGGGGPEFQARMLERFKSMSPDEQKQFIARMKERGADTSAFESAAPKAANKKAAPATSEKAQTIDALFAPLPPVESRGRAWLFMDRELKPVNLRLGVTDGTYTELLSGELQDNMEVVTGVTGLGPTRATPTPQGTGNPLMPGRGPGGPGGGRGPR
jgi:HlyD family secretion protein